MGVDTLDGDTTVLIKNRRMFQHAVAKFNYTTYDLQRDQDVVQGGGDRRGVLVYQPEVAGPAPWCYAYVIGVYHVDALLPNGTSSRVEFLWVRWLVSDASTGSNCLERVRFGTVDPSECFGIVDPASIIRACHLIPAFHYGRTLDYLPATSIVRHADGDWKYLYVNKYVLCPLDSMRTNVLLQICRPRHVGAIHRLRHRQCGT